MGLPSVLGVFRAVDGYRVKADSQEFYRRIWNAVAAIPPGRVASYGQIAELAGNSRGARTVGRALRLAPVGSDLPWHRVLSVQGRISIPAVHSAHKEQVRRLVGESVPVIGDRVDMSRYRWQPDLDELVWGPPVFDWLMPAADE
jgi:methylated-DNA-protein-cysteine methyltransferase-like protein